MSDKQKYQLEYLIHSSTNILYNMISTPGGLTDWFADNVTIDHHDIYTFIWDDSEEKAKILKNKKQEFVQFQWLEDKGTDYYFEFRIVVDAITKEVALVITDFAEEGEIEGAKMLWDSQVNQLMEILGM